MVVASTLGGEPRRLAAGFSPAGWGGVPRASTCSTCRTLPPEEVEDAPGGGMGRGHVLDMHMCMCMCMYMY